MSKGRYHSVAVKQVCWTALSEQVVGRRMVLAIDVAKEDFVASIFCDDELVTTIKWAHPQETAQLLAGISELRGAGVLEAAMEPSGTYGDALRWQLERLGVAVFRVSPKRVHDAAEVYDGVPSIHDAKAAQLIGLLHCQGRSERWEEATDERRAVKAQLSRLHVCKKRYHDDLNRLEAQLSRHWPEALGVLALDSVTLHRLIAAYGSPAHVCAQRAEARALMRRSGGHWLKEEKITRLLSSAEHTLGVPCVAQECEWLQWLSSTIIQTHEQLHQIERAVEHRMAGHSALAPTAQLVGKVTSAVMLAAMGDATSYPSDESYCKAMGMNLKERSSGRHKGRLKITKRGPSVVRFYLYFAALRLIASDADVQRWYRAKTQRPGAIKNKTVIELMRKLAKALWHMARGEPYRVDKLINLKAVDGQ